MDSTKNNSNKMLSPREFAQFLGVSRRTFQTWRAAGKLPPPDVDIGRVLRWAPETIRDWLSENKTFL